MVALPTLSEIKRRLHAFDIFNAIWKRNRKRQSNCPIHQLAGENLEIIMSCARLVFGSFAIDYQIYVDNIMLPCWWAIFRSFGFYLSSIFLLFSLPMNRESYDGTKAIDFHHFIFVCLRSSPWCRRLTPFDPISMINFNLSLIII